MNNFPIGSFAKANMARQEATRQNKLLEREESNYPTTRRLPLQFDAARLQHDAAQFAPEQWQAHFNTHVYDGDWSGISLRMLPDAAIPLFPEPSSRAAFIDAPALAQTRYVPDVLGALDCQVNSARFLKLAAGSSIKRHRDYQLGIEDGEVRLHIPVQTNALVEFFMDDVRVPMAAGELWFLDRDQLDGTLQPEQAFAFGGEIEAIAWSFAAATAIAMPLSKFFHPLGYRGHAPTLAMNFALGVYPGVQGLIGAGLAANVRFDAPGAYPALQRWLRA